MKDEFNSLGQLSIDNPESDYLVPLREETGVYQLERPTAPDAAAPCFP